MRKLGETRHPSINVNVEGSFDRKSFARQTSFSTRHTTDSALSNETNHGGLADVESTLTRRIRVAVLESPICAGNFCASTQNESKTTGFCGGRSRTFIQTPTHILERSNETRVYVFSDTAQVTNVKN